MWFASSPPLCNGMVPASSSRPLKRVMTKRNSQNLQGVHVDAFFCEEVSDHLSHAMVAVTMSQMEQQDTTMSETRISTDPEIMMGKPCIKGTRITVELILRKLGAGRSFGDLLEAWPSLDEEDLRAALAFAADYMQHETVIAAE